MGGGAAWGRPNGRPQRRGVRGAALAALRAARPGLWPGREQAPPAQEPPPEPLSGPAESLRLSAGRCAAPPPKKILLYKQGPLFSSSAHYFSAVKIYSPETRQRRISPLTASAFRIPRAFSSAVFPSLSVILAPPGRITSASHEAGTFILRV